MHYPTDVCGPLFEEELEYWGLDSNQVTNTYFICPFLLVFTYALQEFLVINYTVPLTSIDIIQNAIFQSDGMQGFIP